MVCLVTNVLVTVVGLKLLSTPLAICALVMIPAAAESMVRPEGAAPDVVGLTFVVGTVVGVAFDADVAVAATDVLVAFKDVVMTLPVCFSPW